MKMATFFIDQMIQSKIAFTGHVYLFIKGDNERKPKQR